MHIPPPRPPARQALRSTGLWPLFFSLGSLPGAAFAQQDTGLAQQLRQQLASDCYGFVDHDPSQVRGFEVNEAFQLQRDGYPWARFDPGSNLLIARQEVLVGGPGMACGDTPPGGTVNLVSRRQVDLPDRTMLEVGQFGGVSLRHETAPLKRRELSWRVALREEHERLANHNRLQLSELATQLDWRPNEQRLIRVDFEWQRGNLPSGTAWPALQALPANAAPGQSLEQPWSRVRNEQSSLLVALEETLSERTRLKLGLSEVHYTARWNAAYLEPENGGYAVSAYAYPHSTWRFSAHHGELTHHYGSTSKHHFSASWSHLSVREPDLAMPRQALGLWQPGRSLPNPILRAAESQRQLNAEESRINLRNSLHWSEGLFGHAWQIDLAGRWMRFRDDNAQRVQQSEGLAPSLSLAWWPAPAWRLQLTRSEGLTGRQFASLTSAAPHVIQPPGQSLEQEFGVRWTTPTWQAGLGVFELIRPYRFEQQTISVWRGKQVHRGAEATLAYNAPQERGRLVLTGQALRAQIVGTGDSSLDGKQAPSVPAHRVSLYGEWKLAPGSAWTATLLGEHQARRATFDDNTVFAPGYTRWDVGLQWQGRYAGKPMSLLLTVQNLSDVTAWEWVGGGVAYRQLPRTAGLTLIIGGT